MRIKRGEVVCENVERVRCMRGERYAALVLVIGALGALAWGVLAALGVYA